MPVETGLLITGQGRGFVSSAPTVATIAKNTETSASAAPIVASVSAPSGTNTSAQAKTLRAQEALNALDQANKNWAGLRKSMAAMRLQRLVGIIKVLALYGGDPKMVAQRAAELARELKGAVKEFAASGGDPSTVPGANVDPTAAAGSTGTGQGPLQSALVSTVPPASASSTTSSGFVFQASSLLSQLRTVVASSHTAKTPAAKDRAQQQFDAAAGNAAAALDQAKNSVNLLT
jgi:hypothetical protein